MLREIRNQFSPGYPDDIDLRAALLNKAYSLAPELLATLKRLENFSAKYA
ncbi:MAG: hypothetical protein LUO80_02555 [Methylococcaceae bacterium]|nr:hypothetical protein [Methylococcaceae bacterium]